jgi:phosphomannomutase
MVEILRALRKKMVIAFVGGSDIVKITEQLLVQGNATGNNRF